MLDYEEYFIAEVPEEEYDYNIMSELLLKHDTKSQSYWDSLTAYELMSYVEVLSEFYADVCDKELKSDEFRDKLYEKIFDDLEKCYQVFLERFQENSDVLVAMSEFMGLITFWVVADDFMDMNDDKLRKKSNEYLEQAVVMKNPYAIVRLEENKREPNELRKKCHDAIAYINSTYPESLIKEINIDCLECKLKNLDMDEEFERQKREKKEMRKKRKKGKK